MHYKKHLLNPFGVMLQPIGPAYPVGELNQKVLQELFDQHQLIVLRGFQTFPNGEAFSHYCQRWGSLSEWPFGSVLELTEQDDPKDHIFDNSYMPLHWDGMYRPEIPEYQIFHCKKAPAVDEGGRTTFSNTILALKYASMENKSLWKKVIGTYRREMAFYNSQTTSPIITRHPYKDYFVIRYNEPPAPDKGKFINPPLIKFSGLSLDQLNDFKRRLETALYDARNLYAHQWSTGDVVIADNFSLLHGREAFLSRSSRHLQRVQVLSSPAFKNPGLESYQ